MTPDLPTVGLIGLGTMGANLALNIAEKGFPIAVFNRTVETTRQFHRTAEKLADRITPCDMPETFVQAITRPRNIILMVPAGNIVDRQIDALRPLLADGDLIIDGGNANFRDTNRRAEAARSNNDMFVGIGVSGGEQGARHGPSIMGGGDREGWNRIEPILQAVSAKYRDTPCATYMGEAGAGHYVKMVHNGIEYADMQMIAEIYGLMRDGLGFSPHEIAEVLSRWNEGPLKSYLIEISAAVSAATDPETGKPVLDIILDSAGQKGTGRWTAIEALHLATPVTTIDAAVAARNLSALSQERREGETVFGSAPRKIERQELTIETMEAALLAGKIAGYAQGFEMLRTASAAHGWSLPLPEIAEVWREGCIIRSAMLNDMAAALRTHPRSNLMFAPAFAEKLGSAHMDLRKLVSVAALSGIAAPALSAALSYFDMARTGRGTANMIQAQRDYFGAHSFRRTDADGDHHGPWAY